MAHFGERGIERISIFFNKKNRMNLRILSLSALSLLFLVVYIVSPKDFGEFRWTYFLLAVSGSIVIIIFLKSFIGIEKSGYLVLLGNSLVAVKGEIQKKFNLARIADPYIINDNRVRNLVILDLDSSERVRIPVDIPNADELLKKIKERRNILLSKEEKMEHFELDGTHARTALISHECSFSLMILLMALSINLALSAMPLAESIMDKMLAGTLFAMLPLSAALGSRLGTFLATLKTVRRENLRFLSIVQLLLLSIASIIIILLPLGII